MFVSRVTNGDSRESGMESERVTQCRKGHNLQRVLIDM